MASGSFSGSGSYVNLKISWSSTKGTGGSTVNATLYAVNNSNAYFYATVNQGYSITINGGSKSGSTATLSSTTNGSATLISHSVWVAYTGNKSITISGAANMSNIYCNNAALGNRSVSGTAVLDKVGEKPPVPTVSAPTTSTISETATSITVSWAKSTDYSGAATYTVQVSKNGGSYTNVATGIANGTTSRTYTITAGQGNTYVFRVCAVNDIGSSDYSYSGTVTTNSISAPTIGNIATYNPYVGNLSISHTGGSQTNGGAFSRYCHIYYDYGGSSQTYIGACNVPTNTTTTLTMTTNNTVKSNVLSVLGTNTYSSGKFYAVAWNQNSNGSRSSYTVKSFTININTDGGAAPTLNSPTLSGGYGDYKSTCFVVGRHNVTVTSGSASVNRAPNGTTLSYKITCTGANDVNSNTATFSGLTAGKKTITVTVTDSRGLSASKTVYCRYQTWAKPTVTITKAERDETDTTTINVEYSISYTPIYAYSSNADTAGTQLNAIINQHYTTNTTYTACTNPFSITGTNNELSYDIKVRVGDKFVVTEDDYGYATKTVGSVKVYISTRSHGVGLNCVPEVGYRLHVGGALKTDGQMEVEPIGSTIGYQRFDNDWVGLYSTHEDAVENTNRKGWIGHNSTDDLHIKNEKNGYIKFVVGGKVLGIAADSEGYVGFSGEGGYVRTPTNGLLPNTSGGNSTIGTEDWRFANGYFTDLSISGNLLPRVIYMPNADSSATPTYPYVGLYQWGEEFQISARDANRAWKKDMIKINVGTGALTTSGKIIVGNGYVDSASDTLQLSLSNGKYLKIAADSNGHTGLSTGTNWLRAPVNGLLPNAAASDNSGNGSLGSTGWYWRNAYITNLNISSKGKIFLPSGSRLTMDSRNAIDAYGAAYPVWTVSGDNRLFNIQYSTQSNGTVYLHTDRGSGSAYGITIWASDKILKNNIKDTKIRYALDKISQIKHVEFDWKNESGHVDLGYIADDMEEILPSLIFEVEQKDEDDNVVGYNKHINHTTLIPLITMGMQELIEEKDLLWDFDNLMVDEFIALQDKVNNLEKQVEELKALI